MSTIGGGNPIEVEGLVRRFGALPAVNGIDMIVNPGEIYGFLGPNGAGKTTCVRMLVTLLRPTAGRARVAGFDVVAESFDVRRVIGVALQEAAIDPLMSGRELLALQGALHGLARPQMLARSAELLERVGLIGAADRRVRTYSGGMRRRLDLALALIHQPKILFLDEPTTGLDPTSRTAVWEEVRNLNVERGTTVFLTTQYLEEADRMSDRVAIIDQGRIVCEGRPADLKAQVGFPTLSLRVAAGEETLAAQVLASFGELVPGTGGHVAVRLPGGAAALAPLVRALDEARLTAESLELTGPSLDDVFADATGRRLEGVDRDPPAGGALAQ